MDFYCVCICCEEMRYGGPEEGGWWYDAGHPTTDPGLAIHTKVFADEAKAWEHYRKLSAICTGFNDREYEYEYWSVLGGQRMAPHMFENEYPHPYPEERPHYE